MSRRKVYLDSASGTFLLPQVSKEMRRLLRGTPLGNPASLHIPGKRAYEILEASRAGIARTLSAHTDEIIFTGSGTESIALAIMGSVYTAKKTVPVPHIITSTIEHSAVTNTCRLLEERGDAEVTYISPTDETGLINISDITNAVKENTVIISIHAVNGEIGVMQPIEELIKAVDILKEKKYNLTRMRFSSKSFYPYIHIDAAQAYAHIDLTPIVRKGIDLVSFNSVKIGGPSGIGALYKRRDVQLSPVYGGGGQELSLRPGTASPVLAHGFYIASALLQERREKTQEKYGKLKAQLMTGLEALSTETQFPFIENSSAASIPAIVSISFPYFSGQQCAIELDARGIAVASKSACNTGSDTESVIIQELRKKGRFDTYTDYGTIRISFSDTTAQKDIILLLDALKDFVRTYRGVLY